MVTVDYIVIASYVVLLLGIGIFLKRKAQGGMEEYFLGGRKLPWYFLGTSGMAGWFDLTGTMLTTSFLFLLGARGLFVEFRGGAVLILVFLLCFTGKWHRRSGVMTAAEWMQFRFGKGKDADAARLLTALVSILPALGMIGLLARGTGLFLSMFFPYSPNLCAAGLLIIAVLYTMMSGFYGVVVSDLLQSFIILIAAVFIGFLAYSAVPSSEFVGQIAQRVTGNPDWTAALPAWEISVPPGGEYELFRYLFVAMGFYLAQQTITGLSSGTDQKYFGSRSDREVGKLNLLVSWLISVRWPMMMGLAVLGLFLVDRTFDDMSVVTEASALIKSYQPEITKSGWHTLTTQLVASPERCDPGLVLGLQELLGSNWKAQLPLIGYEGIVDPERILPAVILDLVPAGFLGLVLVATLAASMSTFDTTLNWASSIVVKDLFQRWIAPKASDKTLIRVSWLSTISIAGLGYFLGIHFGSINQVWDWVIMSITTGLFVPGFLRLYWWRMNGWGVAFGMAAGGLSAIGIRVYSLLNEVNLAPWTQFAIVGTAALLATIIGCLKTKPTDLETLLYFYKKTRPWGKWGPVKKHLTGEQQAYIDRENKRDLLSVPIAFVYQVTLFLLPMLFIIHRYDAFFTILPIFVVACVALYLVWWKNQRPDRAMENEPS